MQSNCMPQKYIFFKKSPIAGIPEMTGNPDSLSRRVRQASLNSSYRNDLPVRVHCRSHNQPQR